MRSNYFNYDITFCMKRDCKIMKCERNPKHIKYGTGRPISAAYFEDTEYCMKNKENK